MGFKIQLITGILLFTLLICSSSGSNHRQTRQTSNSTHLLVNNENTARNSSVINKKKQNEITDNNDKKLENDHKLLELDDILKLPINLTTTEKTETNFKNAEVTKLKLSQPYQNVNSTKEHQSENEKQEEDSDDFRDKENARSIDVDINKYVSPDFHNINNVFTLPISADTEKYLESDFDKKPSTYTIPSSSSFSYNSELTTPKTDFFDSKYKEAVQSIDQKLEHLDDLAPFVESEETINHNDKEHHETNLEQLILEHEKQPNSTLDYSKVKEIAKNDTISDKHHLGKDLSVEESSKTRFESFYNDTKVYDKIETSTSPSTTSEPTKVSVLTTTFKIPTTSQKPLTSRKVSTLTKPPFRNNSHILSNKIDTEASKLSKVERLIPRNETSKNTTKLVPFKEEASSTIKNVAITKRGSIKYIDSLTTTPLSIIRKNKTNEQVVQENKVYAVHVEPPETTTFIEESTTLESTTPISLKNDEIIETSTSERPEDTTATEIVRESSTKSTNLSTTKRSFETILTKSVKDESVKLESEESTVSTKAMEETTTEEMKEDTTVEMRFKDLDPKTESTTLQSTTEELTTIKPMVEESLRSSKSFNITTVNIPETTENLKMTTEENITTTNNEEELLTTIRKENEKIIEDRLKSSSVETTTILSETTSTTLSDTTTKSFEEATTLPNEISKSVNKSNSIIDYLEEDHNKSDAGHTNNKSTTEIVFIHIENVDNHTTLHPENVNPSYTYPTPINIEDPITRNKSEGHLEKEIRKPDVVTDNIIDTDDTTETPTENGLTTEPSADNKGTIAAIVISTVGAVCLILLAGLLYVMRKRQKRFNYGQRCTPVSLDDYSMDNISVYGSVNRRKGAAHRSSKRSYGNAAFDDPNGVTHPLNFPALAKFANNFEDIKAEYEDIPQIVARASELPEGCETKNRYANVIPLPETRVFLQNVEGSPNSDYINANYVTGPKNIKGYYIACQAPMENTVDDFWRMVWEQESKVILMITHLFENGIEKCVDYLPPSEVLDCHRLFGDFQVTLKKRDVKEKYIISNLQLKNMVSNSWREVTHFWYLGWPEKGVPSEGNSLIAFLIEARSYMKTTTIDKRKELQMTTEMNNMENGKNRSNGDVINPVVVHCSPGTGRTGVVIACDIAIREFEQTRLVDIPKIVYKIRRDRANAVQTKEQYEFIYKVVSLYAAKLTGGNLDSI